MGAGEKSKKSEEGSAKADRGFCCAQFIINAQQPASDKIFDVSAFEKFLQDRIKVEGRTNNLGDNVVIQQAGEGKIEVIAHNELSGRYLKYLYVVFLPLLARLSMPLFSTLDPLDADSAVRRQDEEVPQEAAAPRLAPRRLHLARRLRAQVLQRRQRRGRRGRRVKNFRVLHCDTGILSLSRKKKVHTAKKNPPRRLARTTGSACGGMFL